jgi:hypothetical protein
VVVQTASAAMARARCLDRGAVAADLAVGQAEIALASDHFEELGAPPELFHGGFGLLTVGNLRKSRYWALGLLARLGRSRLPVQVSGDGQLRERNTLDELDPPERDRGPGRGCWSSASTCRCRACPAWS